jgi:hypothetical protein
MNLIQGLGLLIATDPSKAASSSAITS